MIINILCPCYLLCTLILPYSNIRRIRAYSPCPYHMVFLIFLLFLSTFAHFKCCIIKYAIRLKTLEGGHHCLFALFRECNGPLIPLGSELLEDFYAAAGGKLEEEENYQKDGVQVDKPRVSDEVKRHQAWTTQIGSKRFHIFQLIKV